MPTLFSKEHLLSRSHPDNLVSRSDLFDPLKSDPSDPDCPGHPTTHFNFNPSRKQSLIGQAKCAYRSYVSYIVTGI